MKRNEIYNKLIKIRSLLCAGSNIGASYYLDKLINDIDIDQHAFYDEFELLQDIESRYQKLQNSIEILRKDIEFVKNPINLRKNR